MIKTNNTKCSKSPPLMDGQHIYEIEGKCIYCGKKEEGPRKTIKPAPGQTIPESITQDHINGLILAYEMNGRILAALVRVDGMKADNEVRRLQESSPAYHGEDFDKEAINIESYASYLRVMRKVGVSKFRSKYSEGVIVNEDSKESVSGS